GYNFDAITCESCKAFFRRNALKTKIQKCNFESSCLVSVITRKFCPACRLAKCFKVGMKREWILNRARLGDTINGVDQNDSDRILTAAKEGGAAPETPFVITLSFVRRFVKFVKILPEFELIGKQDAGRLIKGGAFNFILMRGVAIYSPDSDSFAFKLASTGGRHSISLSTVAQCLADSPGGQQLMSDYRSFMRNYHEDSRGDQMALTLLQLIDFYNPARPGLSSMRTVDSVQQGYLVLLKRYIDSAWPKHCACNVYFRLLNRLTELESLGQRFGSLCNTGGSPLTLSTTALPKVTSPETVRWSSSRQSGMLSNLPRKSRTRLKKAPSFTSGTVWKLRRWDRDRRPCCRLYRLDMTSSRSKQVFTGRNRQRGTLSPRAPEKLSIAEPAASSSWMMSELRCP
uniref:Nuclear receptor domain-containing protein n=1 Tax=Macrostomum lignano TaxID=282301 RepID=A0A1I8FCU9_9PLAT